jgi:hypothetical protein
VQGLQTLGLHCSELLVNISRDENAWRKTNMVNYKPKAGSSLESSGFLSALCRWEYLVLIVMKSALHWMLGQSLVLSFLDDSFGFSYSFDMNSSRLIIYTLFALVFAVFNKFLALRRPKDSQPAAWVIFKHSLILLMTDTWTIRIGFGGVINSLQMPTAFDMRERRVM